MIFKKEKNFQKFIEKLFFLIFTHFFAEKNQSMLTLEGLRSRLERVSAMNLNWRIVILCWLQKMNATLSIVTLTTLTTIIFMTNFGWARDTTVKYVSVVMLAVGAFAVIISALYFYANLGKLWVGREIWKLTYLKKYGKIFSLKILHFSSF